MSNIDFSTKPLFLAPLAGFSDPPLRGVVKQFGCDVTVSEMISANALIFENEKTIKMFIKNKNESPYIVQIMGSDFDVIKKAVNLINKFDEIDGIDLNCGCPVPKVIRQHSGSALLLDLDRLYKIIDIIKTTSNKKYTSVKIRLGFNEINANNIAKKIEEAGADFITIHGRTRLGAYTAEVNYDAIADVKKTVSIPVVANGDISFENYQDVLTITNCDGLMIGRASIGNPWIFYEIKSGKQISNEIKKEIIISHFDKMIKHYGEHGVSIFRKHLHRYSKGYNDAGLFREEINFIKDSKEIREKIENFF